MVSEVYQRRVCGNVRWCYKYRTVYTELGRCRVGNLHHIDQCFSTAGPRPGTGPWHQLYRVARGSPGICHFSFLSIFHEYIFYRGNILRRRIFLNVSKSSDPERLHNICVANVSDQDFISPVTDN
jgi:hypothetical protein